MDKNLLFALIILRAMSPSHPQPQQPVPQSGRRLLLRRLDQVAVAALVFMSLVGVASYWTAQGGFQGRQIEIDRATPQSVAFEVDINLADWPELSALPNIGETLARRIVESRDAEGPFADVDDLQRVRGIGPRTLEQLRPYLRPIAPGGNVAAR
jgi:competence protein ComEA